MTNSETEPLRPVVWHAHNPPQRVPGTVRYLDQTRLPGEVVYIETDQLDELCRAIRELQVRGAPAIGITAAMALAANLQHGPDETAELMQQLELSAEKLAATRPTAVNLFWALERMRRRGKECRLLPPESFKEELALEACRIRDEDAATCVAIGRHGAALLKDGDTVLTHCNAGALATAETGTALAPVYQAHTDGKRIAVIADETRPLLQGARLTAWELIRGDIEVTLICDNMAAQVMREGRVNAVFTGADRIAANGDTANKIGTYGLALLANAHKVPFYICAPFSTIDMQTPDGSQIPIEQRAPEEVTAFAGARTAPEGVKVYNPAFDVTPAALISAIVTEHGIIRGDLKSGIAAARQ